MSPRGAGRLRIVAGSYRGHRIDVPPGAAVRPTADRVREAVFSALGALSGARVLDLFAGSGALGLEALSRGARECVFVESDRRAAVTVRANVRRLGLEDRSEVWVMDYRRSLERLAAQGWAGDLLFLDPPYRMLPAVLADVAAHLPGVVRPGGLVVVEGARDTDVASSEPTRLPDFEVVFERRYGDTVITMIEKGTDTP